MKKTAKRTGWGALVLMTALIGLAVSAFVLCGAEAADEYKLPARKATIMVTASAGGGFDQMARSVTTEWGKKLGTVFEFGYGGSTTGYQLCMDTLASARKGEYAVMTGYIEGLANVIAYQNAPYKLDEWIMVGGLYSDANTMMIRKDDTRWKTLSEFIEYARNAKEPVTISTTMPLSPTHVNAVIFVAASGINANIVPFSGGAPARNALLGGHVDMSCGSAQTTVSLTDQVNVIGVLGKVNQLKDIWDCEILGEFNKDFDMPDLTNHDGMWVHKSLIENDPKAYEMLVSTYKEALESESTVENFKKLNNDRFVEYLTPDEMAGKFDAYVEAVAKYADKLDQTK